MTVSSGSQFHQYRECVSGLVNSTLVGMLSGTKQRCIWNKGPQRFSFMGETLGQSVCS